jgi:Zn-dependent M28 family amino/carboxypeptidase
MSFKPTLLAVLLSAASLLSGCNPPPPTTNSSPTPSPTPATGFDAQRAFANVRKQVDFGPRPAGSAELAQTRAYIIGELKSYGLTVTEDAFEPDTPIGKQKMVNVVAELPGETNDVIILCSHYDTKLFRAFRFVGANDGGSSTGALMEIARVLAASGKKPKFTYRFVFFDGEEAFCEGWDQCKTPTGPDNTYGSRHYADLIKSNGDLTRLRALILLDMIGYKQLDLGRDMMADDRSRQITGRPSWLVDVVWATGRELGHRDVFLDSPEDVGGDDHAPFLELNVMAMDIIQLAHYPYWHTAEDTLDKIAPASLKIVGDTVIASLPKIEAHYAK